MSPDQRVELTLLPTLPNPTHTDSGRCCSARHDSDVDDPRWQCAARQVRWLSWVSLLWMSAEGAIGLVAGVRDASIALVGWAIGSVIEGLAATAAFGWPWLDPIVALGLGAWAVREGVSSWRGTGCC